MKQFYLKIFSVVIMSFLSMTAQAQSAYYLHLKDGRMQVFYTDFVDSMTVSRIDTEGVEHDDYVTQQFWMADSVFQYPLADIDSISFVTPETILQPGVIDMAEGLIDYVTSGDSLSFTLSSSTPSKMLPKKGDKVVYTEMTEMFPIGFAGEVANISLQSDKYVVDCNLASLSEIFKCYYGKSTTAAKTRTRGLFDEPHAYFGTGTWTEKYTLDYSNEINRNLQNNNDFDISVGGDIHTGIEISPQYTVHVSLIITEQEGTYYEFSCIGTTTETINCDMSGTLSIQKKWNQGKAEVPIQGIPFVALYVEPYSFIRSEASMGIDFNINNTYKSAFLFNWSSKHKETLKNQRPISRNAGVELEAYGYFSGSLQIGLGVQFGFKTTNLDLVRVYMKGEVGVQLGSDLKFVPEDLKQANSSTRLYEVLKNSSISCGLFRAGGCGAQIELGVWEKGTRLEWQEYPLGEPIFEIKYAPKFSETKANRIDGSPSNISAGTLITGRSLINEVGFSVLDSDGNVSDSKLYDKKYDNGKSFSYYKMDFDNIKTNKEYTVYPLCRFFGYDILAEPRVEITKHIVILTLGNDNITQNSAEIRGYIDGYDSSAESGNLYFYYNTTGNPSKDNGTEVCYGQFSQAYQGSSFRSNLEDLTPNTTYYYVAAAEIDGEMFYGDVQTFQTKKAPLTVTTLESSRKSSSTAILNGRVENITEGDTFSVGFEYGDASGTLEYVVEASNCDSKGNFSVTIDGLQNDVTYNYRAYAYRDNENYYGEIMSITASNQDEFNVLRNFYENTNGDNWTDNTNWLTNEPGWTGVDHENGYIYNIDLSNNNLVGNAIFDCTGTSVLDKCFEINLSGNNLSSFGITSMNNNDRDMQISLIDNKSTLDLNFSDIITNDNRNYMLMYSTSDFNNVSFNNVKNQSLSLGIWDKNNRIYNIENVYFKNCSNCYCGDVGGVIFGDDHSEWHTTLNVKNKVQIENCFQSGTFPKNYNELIISNSSYLSGISFGSGKKLIISNCKVFDEDGVEGLISFDGVIETVSLDYVRREVDAPLRITSSGCNIRCFGISNCFIQFDFNENLKFGALSINNCSIVDNYINGADLGIITITNSNWGGYYIENFSGTYADLLQYIENNGL